MNAILVFVSKSKSPMFSMALLDILTLFSMTTLLSVSYNNHDVWNDDIINYVHVSIQALSPRPTLMA